MVNNGPWSMKIPIETNYTQARGSKVSDQIFLISQFTINFTSF